MSRLTITRRLIALVTVPLVFTGVFAGWALFTSGRDALSAARLTSLVGAAREAGVLAEQLQHERAAATAVLVGGEPFEQLVAYRRAADETDAAIATYRAARSEVSVAPASAQVLLERIDDQVRRLPSLRDDVREGPTVALSAVAFAYRIAIADLVALRETAAQANGGSAEILGEIRAAGALSRATEYLARLQVEVLHSHRAGVATTPAGQQAVLSVLGGYREAVATFAELAPTQWQDWLDIALTGSAVLTTQRVADEIARTPAGGSVALDIPQWMEATRGHIALLHQVERQVDDAIRAEVDALYRTQLGWVVAEAIVVVIALMVAVVMAIGQSRSMIRRLRALAHAARSTAFVSLPAMVDRLRAMGNQTVDPEAFASQAEAPTPDQGSDEIADVSSAFVSVHRQAIRTAAELANMRAGVSQIFLHLARRNQRLVGVLMRELDGAERDERDPDRLATLFRLDQLATRMGRYNDNLLVVGGQTASRVDASDVALHTVLRGAQSKVEHYRRIEVELVDSALVVRGSAVHDLINLLAEVLDNATAFSPPESLVTVTAVAGGGRVVVRVRDAGVGIPPWRIEAINEALASPPAIDISAVRSMGLTVVAHIAARHAIPVHVMPGATGGTLVEVGLPPAVCVNTAHQPARHRLGPSGPTDPDPQARAVSGPAFPPAFAPASPPNGSVNFAWFRTGDAVATPGRRRGVADTGWAAAQRAASAAATTPTQTPTGTGLPRRAPMANLVPGSVPDGMAGAGAVDQRDPGMVAASVAAFALGNANSRARHADRSIAATHHIPAQRAPRAADPSISEEHR